MQRCRRREGRKGRRKETELESNTCHHHHLQNEELLTFNCIDGNLRQIRMPPNSKGGAHTTASLELNPSLCLREGTAVEDRNRVVVLLLPSLAPSKR